MWRKNRFLSLTLAGANLAFWLCLRDLHAWCERLPLLAVVYDVWFQLAAFFALGFALAWGFHAWAPGARRWTWLGPVGVSAGFALFQWLYNRALARWGVFYVVKPWVQLAGVGAGAALGALLMRGDAAAPEEERVSLAPISVHRSHLMGIGMLAVILLHTRSMDVRYVLPLDIVTRLGNAGVDVFLFVSGIGMVYSLCGNPGAWSFYRRRARRIYPEAMPWIAAYSLICLCVGKFTVRDAVVTSLGIGNLVRGGGFNWYISFLLLFYLLAPLLFRLLRQRRTRWLWAALIVSSALVALLLLYDVLNGANLLIAVSRFPIFIIGMVAGFWLKEGRGLTRSEYRSMVPAALGFLALAWLLSAFELYPIVGSMWLCYCVAAPVGCLAIARALDRAGGREGRILRFLRWSGENSLLLYVWNILLVRFYAMFFYRYLEDALNLGHAAYAFASVLANYLIVYLIQRIKTALRRRAA